MLPYTSIIRRLIDPFSDDRLLVFTGDAMPLTATGKKDRKALRQ